MELSLWKAIVLGATQGFTEFLPISSSGHLALAERWLGVTQLSLSFEIIVHIGTLLALVYYFRRQLLHLSQKYWLQIVVATIPAIGFGLLLKPYLETAETSPPALAIQFLFSAFFMFVADQLLRQEDRQDQGGRFWEKVSQGLLKIADRAKLRYQLSAPNSWQAFFVGLFQALAILPAVSRSGATLFAGLIVGLPRTKAFEFAFIISIPAIAGAITLDLVDLWQGAGGNQYRLGLLSARHGCFGPLRLPGLMDFRVHDEAFTPGVLCMVSGFGKYSVSIVCLNTSHGSTRLFGRCLRTNGPTSGDRGGKFQHFASDGFVDRFTQCFGTGKQGPGFFGAAQLAFVAAAEKISDQFAASRSTQKRFEFRFGDCVGSFSC